METKISFVLNNIRYNIHTCLQSSLLKRSINLLCPVSNNVHGTLMPLPSTRLTALLSVTSTSQMLLSSFAFKKQFKDFEIFPFSLLEGGQQLFIIITTKNMSILLVASFFVYKKFFSFGSQIFCIH